VLHSRPSIDVLFESAADAYGEGVIGVVLTGASDDGAHGLKAIIDAEGVGLVQRPETSYATPMPLAALKACPTAYALNLEQIAKYLQEVLTP
jgi:two-component system chemotaxis response regulator CheB